MSREIKNERLNLLFSRHDRSVLLLRHEVRTGNKGKYTDEDLAWAQRMPELVLFGFYNAFQLNSLPHPYKRDPSYLLYEDVK